MHKQAACLCAHEVASSLLIVVCWCKGFVGPLGNKSTSELYTFVVSTLSRAESSFSQARAMALSLRENVKE